jgi:hypothetical protein
MVSGRVCGTRITLPLPFRPDFPALAKDVRRGLSFNRQTLNTRCWGRQGQIELQKAQDVVCWTVGMTEGGNATAKEVERRWK